MAEWTRTWVEQRAFVRNVGTNHWPHEFHSIGWVGSDFERGIEDKEELWQQVLSVAKERGLRSENYGLVGGAPSSESVFKSSS